MAYCGVCDLVDDKENFVRRAARPYRTGDAPVTAASAAAVPGAPNRIPGAPAAAIPRAASRTGPGFYEHAGYNLSVRSEGH